MEFSKLQNFLIFGTFLFILALSQFSYVMNSFGHNEHMFIAAGYLNKVGLSLYRDYNFVQMPYLPLLYGLFFKLANTYYLVIGKLFSFLFYIISAIIIYRSCLLLSKESFFALCVVILFLENSIVNNATFEASNYILPLAFSLLSYYFVSISINQFIYKKFFLFLAGMFISIAIGTKLYYAFCIFAFFITLLIYPRYCQIKKRILTCLLPFLVGSIFGIFPVLYYLTRDPDIFFFNNLGNHLLHFTWRQLTGYTTAMTGLSKLKFICGALSSPDYLLIIVWIIFCSLIIWRQNNTFKVKFKSIEIGTALISLLVLSPIPLYVFHKPLWVTYFAMPIPFLLIFMSSLYTFISDDNKYVAKLVLSTLVIVSSLFYMPRLCVNIYRLFHPWTVFTMHSTSQEIKNIIQHANMHDGKIATLAPIYAIESNLPIYKELASGPFIYRMADLLTPDQRKKYVAASPKTLNKLLDDDPPAAIFVGRDDRELYGPFIDYAHLHNYKKVDKDFDGGELFLRQN